MYIMLFLSDEDAELLKDTLFVSQDEGPAPEGWKSDRLERLSEYIIKKIDNHHENTLHGREFLSNILFGDGEG